MSHTLTHFTQFESSSSFSTCQLHTSDISLQKSVTNKLELRNSGPTVTNGNKQQILPDGSTQQGGCHHSAALQPQLSSISSIAR